MSSREIAQLTGKEHRHVLRDCDKLNEHYAKIPLPKIGQGYYTLPNTGAQLHREFRLTKMQTLDLLTGYNIELRIKVNRRWEELERAAQQQSATLIPKDFASALRLAADQAEKIQQQQLLIEQTHQQVVQLAAENEHLRKDSDYLNVILQSKATVTVTQIAQDYGLSAKAFNKKLEEMRIQRKVNNQWVLYAPYINKGYAHSQTFNFQHSDGRPDTKMNTQWTQRGRIFLYQELQKEGILPLIER